MGAQGAKSDDELMTAYQGGDTRAFDALMGRYRARVFGFARRVVGDNQLAEDALVEVFFRVHRAAPGYVPQGRFREWLFQITYRISLDLVERERPRGRMMALDDEESGVARTLASSSPSPEAEASQRQLLRSLEATLALVPEKPRAAFILYYGEGMATDEIARALGIGESSVRSYLTAARHLLRSSSEAAGG